MRINTSDIPGYENMSTEQKLAALEEYDFQQDYSGYVKKELYDKTASDLANRKQANRSAMTAAEREMQDMRDQMDTMAQTLSGYKREKDIANLTAKYTSLGYGDLSEATAIAHLDGDNDTLFKNQQMFFDRSTADLTAKVAEMKDIINGKPKQQEPTPQPEYDDFFDGLAGKPILTKARLAARKQPQQGQPQPEQETAFAAGFDSYHRHSPSSHSPSPGTKEFEAGFLTAFDSYRKY